MSWKFSKNTIFSTALVVMLSAGTQGFAQDATPEATPEATEVEEHGDWTVQIVSEDPKVCFIITQPTKSEARRNGQVVTVSRSEIRFTISVIPSQSVAGEPAFLAGYPLKPDGAVKMEIGAVNFVLFPDTSVHAEYAWPAPSDDAKLIAAMRKGSDAVITGVSKRGTTTIDTLSLRGFTAAIEKANELCK